MSDETLVQYLDGKVNDLSEWPKPDLLLLHSFLHQSFSNGIKDVFGLHASVVKLLKSSHVYFDKLDEVQK